MGLARTKNRSDKRKLEKLKNDRLGQTDEAGVV